MSGSATADEAAARGLLELANEDPAAALPQALALLAAADRRGDDRVAAVAGRAAGLAEAYVGDLTTSVRYLEAAVAAAARSDDAELEGEAEMTNGAVRVWAGDVEAGIWSLDRAVAMLGGVKQARALVQRGSIRYRAAEFDGALEDLAEAEPTLREHGDTMWLAHLLTNRGLSLAYKGSLPAAEAAVESAMALYEELGHRFSVAQMLHNLGWVAARLGDVPRALDRFDQAERLYAGLGSQQAELYRDRSSALISVHLVDEAFESAMQAARLLERDGHAAGHAEALARAADAALLADRLDEAIACAVRAEHEFAEQQRDGWARYAELTALRAEGRRGVAEARSWQRACDIADELSAAGLQPGAMAARVLAADLALVAGDLEAAEAELERAAITRSQGSIDLRTEAWLVTARLRQAAGDAVGAARAVDAGLRAVERHQAVQGATETRAHAAGHARRLAALGVALAWASGRPRRLLRWLERTRAGALRYPPMRVPDDAGLAGDLAELRRVEREMRSGGVGPAEQTSLEQRRRRIERDVQQRTRRTLGTGAAASGIDLDALLDVLGDRRLVEYGRVGDRLVAVTVVAGRARRHEGPPVQAVREAIDHLRFGLGRLAQQRGSEAARAAADETVRDAAATLSRLLLENVPVGDAELVLVPPPALHAMPWSLLPAAVGRPISVSPSAELWLRRRGRVHVDRTLLMAGPNLPEAPAEISALQDAYPRAEVYSAASASTAAIRGALERSTVAHLACHGRFRADNPLFSALEMADGWFTVYDFEGLRRVPDLVVLSACDAGLSAERPGDEVMGIVAGLLGSGARAVVAAVGLVPDAAGTRQVMVDFHRRLAAGAPTNAALAAAQQRAVAVGDYASSSFVCFGYS